MTEDEIRMSIKMGGETGILTESEHKMIHRVFEFKDTLVKEIMVLKNDMVCINIEDPLEKIIEKAIEEGFSRLPVYKNNIDNIVGVLYAKDLLSMLREQNLIILQDCVRQPYFISPTKKVSDLLKKFQKGKLHMAIVKDEYNSTLGLITLEDLIEEIIGDIRDEYDIEEYELPKDDNGALIVDAKMTVSELKKAGMELVGVPMEETVAGFVTQFCGKVPNKGEQFRVKNFIITIVETDKYKVKQVKIEQYKKEEQK